MLGDLTMNHIIPIATRYQSSLIDNVYKMKGLFPGRKASVLSARNLEIIEDIACRTNFIKEKVDEMVEARKVANKIESERERQSPTTTPLSRCWKKSATTSTNWNW